MAASPLPGHRAAAWRAPVVAIALATLALLAVLPAGSLARSVPPGAGSVGRLPGDCFVGDGGACLGGPPSSGAAGWVWTNLTSPGVGGPEPRSGASMAYDPLLSAMVLFGGQGARGSALGDTWSFGADGWRPLASDAGGPSARWGSLMQYDAADAQLILFGGTNGSTTFGDTWFLTAGGWVRFSTDSAPPARSLASGAFDPTLGGVVVFGGRAASGVALNDTWLYRTGDWRPLSTPGTAPPPRFGAAAAYSASFGGLALFGGIASGPGTPVLSDLWALHGSGWSNLTSQTPGPVGRPGPLVDGSFAPDPSDGSLLLLGGAPLPGDAAPDRAVWELTAGGWLNVTSAFGPGPSARSAVALAQDPVLGRDLLFGGLAMAPLGDTWSLGAPGLTVFVSATPTAGTAPLTVAFDATATGGSPPYTFAWAFGDGQGSNASGNLSHVYGLVGNYSAVVEVRDAAGATAVRATPIEALTAYAGGHQWSNVGRDLRLAPLARLDASFTYDPALNAAILFGGRGPAGEPLSDTWEFVNNVWINLSGGPLAGPDARWGASLVTDPVDGYLLLFGGTDGSRYLNDTWQFNSSGWAHLTTSGSPSPRAFAQSAFDTADGYVVLFGGTSSGPSGAPGLIQSDTWEYRGGSWQNVTGQLAIAPPPTTGGALAFDASGGSLILFGGSSFAPGGAPGTCYANGGTWSYASGSWSPLSTPLSPPGLIEPSLAYDASDHHLLEFGGSRIVQSACEPTGETWEYGAGAWSNLTGPTVATPPTRDSAAMTFDAAEGVVVLFGGSDAGLLLNDTWVYPTQLNQSVTGVSGNGTYTGGSNGSTGGTNGSGGTTPPGGGGIPFSIGYTLSSTGGNGPLTIVFTAAYVGGVNPVRFAWDFGDSSTTVVGAVVQHRYTVPGAYDPVLTATDASGEQLVRVLATIQVFGPTPVPSTGGPAGPVPSSGGPIAAASLGVGAVLVVGISLALAVRERRRSQEAGGGSNAQFKNL